MNHYSLIDNILSCGLGVLLCLVVLFIRFRRESDTAAELKEETPARVVYIVAQEQAPTLERVEEPEPRYFPRFIVNSCVPLDAEYQIYAQMLCEEYHVNYYFFLAMCESESSFNPEAVGDSGKSQGLMQINKCNWEKYGLDASMVFDNLEIGIRMLAELADKYNGNFDAVVMAYKGGEAFADEWIAAGKRLDACDDILERTLYYSKLITGVAG